MKSPAAAVVVATLLAAFAVAPATADDKPAFVPDPKKGQALSTACIACHTADGSRGLPVNPILAGQHPEYIVKQLREFKEGKRRNAIMQGMVAALSDEDMRHIAAFYGSLKPVPGAARNKELIALGEQIYRGGIASKQVPACAGCHSPNGAGIPAQYPRLGGQHAEYTESTLRAFRSGERANNAQMMTIASRMSDREIQAVSDYIAGLQSR
ncbi:MAG: cytochrome c4 [Rubrivivax sp.]|jgi:cytochrome c553|nr:cytochrome c4 [Rubrivivax sp.]